MNYEDNFIESFSALISSNNNGLKNDLTIIGVITKEGANEGEYYISYQGAEYLVYSTAGTSFRKNDRVYVTVPQGDYNLQKFILGKEKNGDNDVVQYSDPETLITPMQTYTFNDDNLKNTLCLDCTTDNTTRFSESSYEVNIEDLSYKYDTLAIKASFIAMLKDSYSGNYGLKITISGPSGDNKDYFEEHCLDSSNMFGTIYNFYSPSEQMIVLDISNFNSINKITFQLYTLGIIKQGIEDIKEIIIEELELIFGYNKNNSKYGTALLSCAQGEKFNYSPTTKNSVDYSESTEKDLQIILFRKKDDFSKLKLKLYKYNDYDKNWEEVNNFKELDCCYNIQTITNINLDITKKEIRYKCIFFDNDIKIVESNELVFINNAPIADEDSANAIINNIKKGLSIVLENPPDGLHYSYDENNNLIHNSKGEQKTKFFIDIYDNEENITSKVQNLSFTIPNNSMISSISKDTDRYQYTIRTKWSSQYGNNVIQATFVYKGVTYHLSKELYFGYQGTNGSEYTLILNPNSTYVVIDLEGNSISLEETDKTEHWEYETYTTENDKIIKKIQSNKPNNAPYGMRLTLDVTIDGKLYKDMSAVAAVWDGNPAGCDRVEYLSDGITMRYFKQPYDGTNISYDPKNDKGDFKVPADKLNESFTDFFSVNGIIVPVVYSYNTYASSLVNKWNGKSLILDEQNSFIASNMIAAGSKDSQNRFSGVLLGDYKEYADSSIELTGIYGFDRGKQAYAFREDGTAFIGKAGTGRIWFDGNNGIIASDSWFKDGKLSSDDNVTNGTKLDLKNGVFNIKNDGYTINLDPSNNIMFFVGIKEFKDKQGKIREGSYIQFDKSVGSDESTGLCTITQAKINNCFLRGTLDIATSDTDLTNRYASLSSITENNVVKGVFKGYNAGDISNVGACVVSGEGAALKYFGEKGETESYVSVIEESVTIESSVIDLNGQVKLNNDVYINGDTLESYIQSIVSNMLK